MGRSSRPKLVVAFLYETFLSECWDYRERIIPVRRKSIEGLKLVAEAGLTPDVIYIDGDHSYAAVHDDLVTALSLFPRSAILGDDWDWPGVKQAVEEIVQEKRSGTRPSRATSL